MIQVYTPATYDDVEIQRIYEDVEAAMKLHKTHYR